MTREIEISVQNRVAWQTNSVDYICGNGDFVVHFVFDSEWDEHEYKTARFIHNGEHTDVVFSGDRCSVPKILNAKRVEIGVFAGNLYTTTPAFVQCRKSILCGSGIPADPPPDVYAQIMAMLKSGASDEQIAASVAKYLRENPIDTGSKLTIGVVELLADKWAGAASPYSQVVEVPGATLYSQVDLNPSVEQLTIFHDKDLSFVTENEDGIVTVYAIGQKPTNDYTIQVTIKEVST